MSAEIQPTSIHVAPHDLIVAFAFNGNVWIIRQDKPFRPGDGPKGRDLLIARALLEHALGEVNDSINSEVRS